MHLPLRTRKTLPAARPIAPPMVLHVRVVRGSGGGPDKTILHSARYADPSLLRIAAAYIHPNDDPGAQVIRDSAMRLACPLWQIGESSAVDVRTVRALWQLCRKQRVTVWHGHDYKSNALGLLVARMWPMKLVTTVHGWTWDTARTRLYHHVDNFCLPRYEQVMTVSPQLTEHCRGLGIPDDRLTYIPNAIEPEEYPFVTEPRRTAARAEAGISPQKTAIGVIGRLSVEKGVDRALRAFAELRAMGPRYDDTELHIVGDGPQRSRLEATARELGVAAHTRFWGWRSDATNFYAALDALLLPSHTEGMPNVVLEAMASGVSVAATDVGAVRELLDARHGADGNEGVCGVVLDPSRCETWAGQIAPLVVSAARRVELTRRARLRIERRYTFARRMAAEMAVYERVLSLDRRTARLAA